MTAPTFLFDGIRPVFALIFLSIGAFSVLGQDVTEANSEASKDVDRAELRVLEKWPDYVTLQDKPKGMIRIHGSETLQGLLEVLAADFQRLYPEVTFEIRPEGSLLAVAGFAEGEDFIGAYSGLVGAAEQKALKELGVTGLLHIPVAIDHVAIVVHPTNPLTSLSMGQLKTLFSSESESTSASLWKELTGEDVKPLLVGPGFLSGTRNYFISRVIGEGKELSSGYTAVERYGEILQSVAASPAAIGFLSSSVIDDSVRVLGVSENEAAPALLPDFKEADSAMYPLERTLHLLVQTTGEHRMSGLDREFIKYTLSRQGALAVQRARFLPIDSDLAAKALSQVMEIQVR